MAELDASVAQARQIQLAAATAQVVQRDNSPVRMAAGEAERHVRPDEAGAAGDQEHALREHLENPTLAWG